MGCASTVCRSDLLIKLEMQSDDKNCVTLETRDENKIKLHTHAQLQSTLLGVAVDTVCKSVPSLVDLLVILFGLVWLEF